MAMMARHVMWCGKIGSFQLTQKYYFMSSVPFYTQLRYHPRPFIDIFVYRL